jgi:hypothetical protein
VVSKLCGGRAGCRLERWALVESAARTGPESLLVELALERGVGTECTPREVWFVSRTAPDQPHRVKEVCQDQPVLANLPRPAQQPPPRHVATGAGWVPARGVPLGQLAFSSNGLWFASFVGGGILLGDSRTGQPLALSPFEFDKAAAIAFHPSSRHLVAVADSTVLLLAIESDAHGVRLRREADLPVAGDLGLVPPVFDNTGRYLALAQNTGAALYDFSKRRPLLHVYPYFVSGSWVMGFSLDTLYFVEPNTRPCQCDDYQGSDAAIASHRLGTTYVRRLRAQGDLLGPLHFRQAKVASATGLWDARTGKRRVRYRLDADSRIIHVYRLRTRHASVGTLLRGASESYELVLLEDDGTVQSVGVLPEAPIELAVRPQDDLVLFWGTEDTLYVVDLADGKARPVKLKDKLCVEAGQVVPEARCPADGAELERPALTESPLIDVELPVLTPPEGAGGTRQEREEGGFGRMSE